MVGSKGLDDAYGIKRPERSPRVRCGKVCVEYFEAQVRVYPKENPYAPNPTILTFRFDPPADGRTEFALEEVARCVATRGEKTRRPTHDFSPDSHEYRRARKMAIQVVGTYRRKYHKKYGSAVPFL